MLIKIINNYASKNHCLTYQSTSLNVVFVSPKWSQLLVWVKTVEGSQKKPNNNNNKKQNLKIQLYGCLY